MPLYHVTWEIDLEDGSPIEAAEHALPMGPRYVDIEALRPGPSQLLFLIAVTWASRARKPAKA